MYNSADQTYRNQPPVMTEEVIKVTGAKIIAHAKRHQLPQVLIVLHGGEPLLLNKEHFKNLVQCLRNILNAEGIAVDFGIQSNGTLLDNEWVEVLADQKVKIGISIDGPKDYHDRFRIDRKGYGSFDRVMAGVRLLQNHPRGAEIFSGTLTVLNTNILPEELFEFWQFLDVKEIDILLPDANHANQPPKGKIGYGEWMIRFFDLWFDQNREDKSVRFFDSIIKLLFGYSFIPDYIGGKPAGVCVIETDGSIEPLDALKTCKEGLTKLNLNVLNNEIDDLYEFELVTIHQNGVKMLCQTCQECEIRDVCGGGYLPHRYSQENDFNNPSIYCEDLQQLIRHIRTKILNSLAISGT